MKRPLAGVRVLDFTDIWAGPWGTRLLGELGAHVIKVEGPRQKPGVPGGAPRPVLIVSPETDDRGRHTYHRNAYQTMTNPNKDHVALDLKKDAGRELFKGLVQISDVVVENYAPRVLVELGLGYEELRKARPDVILLRVSAMGQTGPEKEYTALGFTAELLSGMDTITGYDGGEPHKTGINYGDPIAAVHGAFAVIAALLRRARTGKGMEIDLALRESLEVLLGENVLAQSMNGRQPPRWGNRHPDFAPHNVYRCQGEDTWVMVAVRSDHEFAALCRVIGRPELALDPRFADAPSRKRNEADVDGLVEAWTRERTHYDAMHRLQEAGVTAGAVLDTAEVLGDPHFGRRGAYRWVPHPDGRSYPLPDVPWTMTSAPKEPLRHAPAFGADTSKVWGDLLGLAPAEVDALVKSEAVLN